MTQAGINPPPPPCFCCGWFTRAIFHSKRTNSEAQTNKHSIYLDVYWMSAFKVAMFTVLESWCVSSETEDLNRAMIVRNRYQKMGGQKRVRMMWELCVLESKLDIERTVSERERDSACACLFICLDACLLSLCVYFIHWELRTCCREIERWWNNKEREKERGRERKKERERKK